MEYQTYTDKEHEDSAVCVLQLCGYICVSKSMPGTIPEDTSLVCCLSLAICRGLTQTLPLFSHLGYYWKAIMLESTPSHPGQDGGGARSSTPCGAHSQGLGLNTYYLPAHAQSETF